MPLSIKVNYRHPSHARGVEPLSPQRKWRAITIATLVLVPAFWSLLAGFVALARDEAGGPAAGPSIAFGLALIPFVFVALAFTSEHPRAPAAVVQAMGLCLLVGILVSALANDAVTGMVAGVGAGGICALRADDMHTWRTRAVAVGIAAAYTFVLVRTAGAITLLSAPIFPFTSIGIADHLAERRHERETAGTR
jgi:purine-cytosine permease-like protein